MSDVVGGATVFPNIKLSVQPQKGLAIVWYNLYKSGHGNTDLAHGACPVIFGSKWIFTKWIHQHGNELLYPCELQPDHPLEN